ncbi:MAG: hypothetical protein GVY06_11345 [Alphaproteobacteria bacterium]|jgi:hypothetical protein|nr:hypothetical protein [Alphaproteobacteria bacterium]
MSVETGAGGGMINALSIEVRIMDDGSQQPVWVSHPDETTHWILDITQKVFEEVVGGLVHAGHHHAEHRSFSQWLSVFAAPTARNREILKGDLHWLVSRLEEDLSARFRPVNGRPVVHLDPEQEFFAASAGTVASPAAASAPSARGGALQAQVVDEPFSHASPGRAGEPPSQGSNAALLWTGAALGGMVIASALLLFNNLEMRSRIEAMPALSAKASQLETDLRLAQEAIAFEKRAAAYERDQCLTSIAAHREMIDDLAGQCTTRPAPTPPPEPQPYPERPNPFESG